MLDQQLLKELAGARRVLIAGAGGGFDLFSGLPLAFALESAGKEVALASQSFTYLGGADAAHLGSGLYEVTARSQGQRDYFPERHLADWFSARGRELSIYCFDRLGVRPATQAWRILAERTAPDAVILVDGGTDSLMRGDEAGLGTPVEDITSILAANALTHIARRYLVCLGFGVDAFHGVCHAHFLENVAALARADAFLGAFSITRDMPEAKLFAEATEFVQARTPGRESIVCASVLSAIDGQYGNHHRLARTRASTLWINPLMSFYWAFRLDAVATRILYADAIRETEHAHEVGALIEAFRNSCKIRDAVDIPV
jgi:hypothetical protein